MLHNDLSIGHFLGVGCRYNVDLALTAYVFRDPTEEYIPPYLLLQTKLFRRGP